jgi:ribonuclease Y
MNDNSFRNHTDQTSEREQTLNKKEQQIQKLQAELDLLRQDLIKKLSSVASITPSEAKIQLLEQIDQQLKDEIAQRIKQAEEQIKLTSSKKAKQILVDAMVHGATDYVAEYTVSNVKLPSDEIKGRIIGREGRNIRTFEQATGVEVEMDETNELRLSSFDPIRREIARRSLLKLISDTRIQPDRIEEIVNKTKTELDKIVLETGEELCHKLKVYNLPLELIKMLGRYKFRFSYGQSMINHTIEETKIGVSIAEEVGADIKLVRLACLLHDIGKVITEDEGSHVQLGVDLLKKYDLPEAVINAVAEHHEDKPFSSDISRIVWIADAISGSRPGARYEPHGDYLKRMKKLEEIANSFTGVIEAIAYQAGRDVRVMVKPNEISDSELTILVYKIAKELGKVADFAGQIKVTGIRETRATALTS